MKTLLLLGAACLLATSPIARAQHSPAAHSNKPKPVEGGTPIPFAAATVVSSVMGKSVVLKMAGGETRHFRLAAKPVYIAADGSAVESVSLERGTRVLIHTMEEGKEVLIDRLFIQK